MKIMRAGVWLAAALSLSFCGGEVDETGGGGGTSIPLDQLSSEIAKAYCAAYQSCLPEVSALTFAGEDCETVLERQLDAGFMEQLQQAIDSGNTAYHADKAKACLDALAALGCDALVSDDLPECDAAVEGSVAEGGDCTYDVECTGDLFCKVDASCPGACTKRGGTGASCETDKHCQSGMVCDPVGNTCTTPGGAGAACGDGQAPPCSPELICVGADQQGGTPGSCSVPSSILVGKVGESCDLVAGPWCEGGAFCAVTAFTPPNTFTSECVAAATSGGACHVAIPGMCPQGEYCKLAPQSTDGTCAPLPTDGQPCAGGFGHQCAAYTRCVEGTTCRTIQQNGGSCTVDEQCYSGWCNGSACAPPDPCTP